MRAGSTRCAVRSGTGDGRQPLVQPQGTWPHRGEGRGRGGLCSKTRHREENGRAPLRGAAGAPGRPRHTTAAQLRPVLPHPGRPPGRGQGSAPARSRFIPGPPHYRAEQARAGPGPSALTASRGGDAPTPLTMATGSPGLPPRQRSASGTAHQ